jgi:hypothetical protein
MSVDYEIQVDGETARLSEPLIAEGGTYALGGSTYAELNVTYNYARILEAAFVSAGNNEWPGMIEWLDGRSVADTIPELEALAAVLPDATDEDYWEATPGNVGHAVAILLSMAREIPTGIWRARG